MDIKQKIDAVVHGDYALPFEVLGRHVEGDIATIRTFQPYAEKVSLINPIDAKTESPMEKVHKDGMFAIEVPAAEYESYTFHVTGFDDVDWAQEDPYRFPLRITDMDEYLFSEGTHYRTYEKMGAHEVESNGVKGVHFAVWAPNASRVSVLGWFNRWDGRHHPMQSRGGSGLWELFIPALTEGDLYKFEVKGEDGFLGEKADPYAFAAELRPRTASMVWDVHKYKWNDSEWMDKRPKKDWLNSPISVYEVHLGSWKRKEEDRFLTYAELADELIPYVKDLGYTHIEMLPISEHPFDGSWGYQAMGYFAPTSRFGNPDEFKHFVDRCHQEGVGVIIDWVPAHFPKDAHGLARFDGSCLYEHADPRQGEHSDWGTLIFNYGRAEVLAFLLSNAMFMADVYHVDGIRVDAVASMLYLDYSREAGEWIPNKFGGRENLEAIHFLKKFNEIVHADYPGFITFAEESTAWPMVSRPTYLGGLGFDFKWNMGWMNDTLAYIEHDPIHRKWHHGEISFSLIYAFTENFILPFSHDEVVHGKGSILDKMPGDDWQQFANARLLYTYMWTHPGKKLLFMGCEFGQWAEWSEAKSLDWHLKDFDRHEALSTLIRDLNNLYTSQKALYEHDFSWDGFEWIDLHNGEQSILAYMRKGSSEDDRVLCVFNLTPTPRQNYKLGVPAEGHYEELLNSDSAAYWGSNQGNAGGVSSQPIAWQEQPHSIEITLPPLSALMFKKKIS